MFFGITLFHLAALITWQLANFTVGQYIFGLFSNDVPKWRCRNSAPTADCKVFESCPRQHLVFVDPIFYSAAMEFNWVCGPAARYKSYFHMVQYLGVLIGTILFGTLSDKFGRKPIGILVVFMAIWALFFSAIAPNHRVLLASRFFVGLSIAGVLVVVCAWIMEVILPTQRMVMRGFFGWGWTRIFTTAVCYYTREWRQASFVSGLCLVPALFMMILVIPESPTWLHSKGFMGQMIKSEMFMSRIAAKPFQYVEHEFMTSKTLSETLRTRGLFQRLSVLWIMWFFVAVCGFANDLNSNTLPGDLYHNQLWIAALIVVSKLLLLFVDTKFEGFTRRMLHIGSQVGTIICFGTLTAFLSLEYDGKGFLIIYLIGTVCIEYTWDACYLITNESMETSSRTSATGSCSFMARIGSLIAPALTHANNCWPPAIFVTVIVLCAINLLISFFFLKETKNVDLDDVHIDEEKERVREPCQDLEMTERLICDEKDERVIDFDESHREIY